MIRVLSINILLLASIWSISIFDQKDDIAWAYKGIKHTLFINKNFCIVKRQSQTLWPIALIRNLLYS